MNRSKTIQSYDNVWDAIANTPEEAANLRVRSELIDKITALIEINKWTQLEAASHCGVTQPRINDLLRGRISRFSLDALVNIASALVPPHRDFDRLETASLPAWRCCSSLLS